MGPRSSGWIGDYVGKIEPDFKLSDAFSQGPSFSNSMEIENKKMRGGIRSNCRTIRSER